MESGIPSFIPPTELLRGAEGRGHLSLPLRKAGEVVEEVLKFELNLI